MIEVAAQVSRHHLEGSHPSTNTMYNFGEADGNTLGSAVYYYQGFPVD